MTQIFEHSQLETSLDWDQVDEVSQAQFHTVKHVFKILQMFPFQIQYFNVVMFASSPMSPGVFVSCTFCRHTKIGQQLRRSERQSSLGRMLREPQSDPHCSISGIAQSALEFASLNCCTVAMLAKVPQEFPGPMETAAASAPSSAPLPFEQLGILVVIGCTEVMSDQTLMCFNSCGSRHAQPAPKQRMPPPMPPPPAVSTAPWWTFFTLQMKTQKRNVNNGRR